MWMNLMNLHSSACIGPLKDVGNDQLDFGKLPTDINQNPSLYGENVILAADDKDGLKVIK
jgi:hypothetical protein